MTGVDDTKLTHRLRIRVCGLVIVDNQVLMVNMLSPTRPEPIWTPPGGGLEFGETITQGVEREIREETGLVVEALDIMYTAEFLKHPYHAVEYYLRCKLIGGTMRLGNDPEFDSDKQFLKSVDYLEMDKLADFEVFPEYLRYNLYRDSLNPDHKATHFIQRL